MMTDYSTMLNTLQMLIQQAASDELLPRFQQIERCFKADGSIVTEADIAMQQRLTTTLQQHWPAIALLGEEMSEAAQQAQMASSQQGLWVLDPLDGTSNFAAGIPCFSVSLALLVEGEVVLGIIYDPLRKECFSAIAGKGAWLNGERLGAGEESLPLSKCIALLDFKRLSRKMATKIVSQPPYSSQRSFGSGALDWCWLAAGRVHLYLHGQQKLWDYSAGQLILQEAGGQSCTLGGEVVFNGRLEARSVVAALQPPHFEAWRRYLFE
ncbi:MAG: inositol monophosphatase [Gammaproteobacteria bacterium]|nr:inositol monophosphatase [Gammaproteobacteria bacterium]MCF6230572.1 inositol monophosphatase [Gammaproteobacteria bacterium]